MTERSLDDFNHERQALDQAHAQNEAGRDTFIALAHTALFAASVSFVGDVTPLADAVWKPVLIAGWLADVVGLLALTFSFVAARRAIDARRQALNDPVAPSSHEAELLNNISLWSFPVALLCLFSFVTANVVHADDQKVQPTATAEQSRMSRVNTAPKGTQLQRRTPALDGGNTSTASPLTAPAASTAAKEVKPPLTAGSAN